MSDNATAITILIADDDPDDRLLIRDALEDSRLANDIDFVVDGEDLMDYLNRANGYESLNGKSLPGLILLDLNMPKKDGREALKEIKASDSLKRIPVVVLTTSKAEEDIYRTYDLGVNSFIVKPVTFEKLVKVMRTVTDYWTQIVQLPPQAA
ncbi:MAG: response regulator [Alphaproteobacteria bacterium]|jgi:CheY-like chemotaxis protein|nr:response regulator [Alphaproteobacteria bacterium]|tara:strand:- start:193 stop:648 length:456 start_codon:yes stop_codon:yes gene_type:complete